MDFDSDILVQSIHCDIWAKDAFGPSSWALPFGPEPVLRDFSWTWKQGEVWAILGSNTSGKDALSYALVGKAVVRPREGNGLWVNKFGENGRKGIVLSFEEAEKALRYSLRFDESDFVEGGQHPGLTVERFLEIETLYRRRELSLLWEELGMEAVKHQGLKYLSTGELRKVLLFKALLEFPSLLVCEDVLEGLDVRSRDEVMEFFQRIIGGKAQPREMWSAREAFSTPKGLDERTGGIMGSNSLPALLFLCDREDQILPLVTHVLHLKDGRVEQAGRWEGKRAYRTSPLFPSPLPVQPTVQSHQLALDSDEYREGRSCLIYMKDVRVAYAERVIFEGFNFELHAGEHCFIQGPNGCGKSTLVKLITGDHPQGWMNKIVVAGIPRTVGECMQKVRMQTSLVSHELHRSFLSMEDSTVLEVVLSGFFGTIGLYEPVGEERIAEAKEALRLCGLSEYADTLFRNLPWGIQRLVLAARAFVRRPPLMILDEPCTGLDDEHRRILLTTLERIAEETAQCGSPTILLISHNPEEQLPCMKTRLCFYQDGYASNGQPRYRWEFTRE